MKKMMKVWIAALLVMMSCCAFAMAEEMPAEVIEAPVVVEEPAPAPVVEEPAPAPVVEEPKTAPVEEAPAVEEAPVVMEQPKTAPAEEAPEAEIAPQALLDETFEEEPVEEEIVEEEFVEEAEEEVEEEVVEEKVEQQPAPTAPVAACEAALRQDADGMSNVVATIPAGTELTVIEVANADWALVSANGITGYIHRNDVRNIAFPAYETANVRVSIFSSRRAVINPGEVITLTSQVEGAEGYTVSYQWECNMGGGFAPVAGANESTYSFAATIETLSYDWRLCVIYE